MKIFTAVEIDYNQFKILEIFKKRDSYFLNNFVNVTIAGLDYHDINSVSLNLNKIINENKIGRKNILTSINGNSVYSFNFILPPMPESDLKIAVEYELKKLLTFPISQCIFDFIYTEKIDEQGNRALNITAFASKDEDINNFKEIFDKSGLKIKSIECKTVSIYNNIRYINKNLTGHLLLCDISDKTIKIVIILNNAINFERTIDGLNLKSQNYDEASTLITDELKRTIDFYFAGKSLPSIDGIILTGIFSGKKGFDAKITEATAFRAYSVSVLNLIGSEKYSFYLSKKLKNRNIQEDYEFFRPLEEMWTTFGLIINR
ncbi:MAG: pilus assembly protein PilM [Deltaproteobacteria bacterium]|jgi:Tfp pilus assembly PilM family ATPase|nr:pilus assembly protein PilM [Deltaproteobacteria bacterium]